MKMKVFFLTSLTWNWRKSSNYLCHEIYHELITYFQKLLSRNLLIFIINRIIKQINRGNLKLRELIKSQGQFSKLLIVFKLFSFRSRNRFRVPNVLKKIWYHQFEKTWTCAHVCWWRRWIFCSVCCIIEGPLLMWLKQVIADFDHVSFECCFPYSETLLANVQDERTCRLKSKRMVGLLVCRHCKVVRQSVTENEYRFMVHEKLGTFLKKFWNTAAL